MSTLHAERMTSHAGLSPCISKRAPGAACSKSAGVMLSFFLAMACSTVQFHSARRTSRSIHQPAATTIACAATTWTIAARAFERVFQLADFVQVKGASLENGLLHVDLVREIPEAKKPRQIQIGGVGAKVLETKAAA